MYNTATYSGTGYGALETLVQSYGTDKYTTTTHSIAEAQPTEQSLDFNYKQEQYEPQTTLTKQYQFAPEPFVLARTKFIGKAEEIQEHIKEAFELTTGKPFPNDILVTVCDEKTMKNFHKGPWNSNIQGFALNRRGFGVSEVFVKHGELARLMLTLGHEIGHVLTSPLDNPRDEEAKAFAFSLAWMKKIHQHNVADLSSAINPSPAKNGLHNVAFDFVHGHIVEGKTAWQVYIDLINKKLSAMNTIELIVM